MRRFADMDSKALAEKAEEAVFGRLSQSVEKWFSVKMKNFTSYARTTHWVVRSGKG